MAIATALGAPQGAKAATHSRGDADAPAAAAPAPAKASTGNRARAKSKAAPTSAEHRIDLPLSTFTLDNGLRVYVLEDRSSPLFALNLSFDVGSRDEDPGRTGFAHFFEHMMFKGSKNVPDGGHFQYVLGVGGEMNASTSFDETVYYDVLPSHYLDMALWLESDRLRSLAITPTNFENQRAAVQEEKAMRENAPWAKAFEDFLSKIWSGSGYGHPPIGSSEDLAAARTEDAQAFFDKHYRPDRAVLVIVGDVTLDEVKTKVQTYFGDIPRGPAHAGRAPVVVSRDKPVEVRTEDPLARTPAYVIGWHTVKTGHPDAYALELLGNVLLRGDSSRIGKILKDDQQLVLGAQFFPFTLRDAGMFASFYIPVQGADFAKIKKIVRAEVMKTHKKGISQGELDKAIAQVLMDTTSSLATNQGRSALIAEGALLRDDPKAVLSDLDKYRAVTLKDIKRVAKEYLTDNWLVLEIVPKTQASAATPK